MRHVSTVPGFQSTLPTRGSDRREVQRAQISNNFNPRSPRGGATVNLVYAKHVMLISIHAPHEGERQSAKKPMRGQHRFQSTLPTRGSDFTATADVKWLSISIHAPHEGERRLIDASCYKRYISIHAPHEGERHSWSSAWVFCRYFNPRSPRGGAIAAQQICP